LTNKIIIYYGPKTGFEKLLNEYGVSDENQMTLSRLVRLDDESNRKYQLTIPSQETPSVEPIMVGNLVSFSDEYASIKVHAILNFDNLFSSFIINNIFLHNPPQLIAKKMEKSFPDITTIIKFQYKQIDEKQIKKINSNFENRIIGQPNAKRSLLRALVHLTNGKQTKPAVILLYGPSGVGKTETAKYLAEVMGGKLFRKQFSMFQNSDYVTYLFGGEHSENSFAKEVLEREANVLLLDEFDKVNPLFHSAFYQFFDEGIFEDNNYSVDARGAIIICTSNYLSENDIKNQLGEPIYSRIETCIKYEELSPDNVKKIINECIEREWKKIPIKDKRIIDKEAIKHDFNEYLPKLKNARMIENFVRQVISDKILDRILSYKKTIEKKE